MSRDCCVVLPLGAKGLSAVCDCGIFWPYYFSCFQIIISVNWFLNFCSTTITDTVWNFLFRAFRLDLSDFTSRFEDFLIKANMHVPNINKIKPVATETYKILNQLRLYQLLFLLNNSFYCGTCLWFATAYFSTYLSRGMWFPCVVLDLSIPDLCPLSYLQQCGILLSVHSDEPVQLPFKLWNSKWCTVSSLRIIEYSSD